MLPIRLTLEGIYSYRERQTINFERLTQARLFGIFGAVGSGKSAILEAMVYAVYGTIDRLSTEVRYNVMNLQADRLFVDFEFLAGDEGRRWRAVVDCKRNRKRFEEVSSPKFSYYVWEDEDWLPCTRKEVTDAIGLSAQNFKRVVIIPQGKFQEFLMLRDKERTEMMMELFGELRRYDLYDRAAALETETAEQASELRGRLLGLGDISAEIMEEKRKELEMTRTELLRLQDSLKVSREREEGLRQTKRLLDEWESRLKEEKALLDQQENMRNLRREVEEYESCVRIFAPTLNREREIVRRREKAESDLMAYRELLEKRKTERDEFAGKFEEVRKAYEERDGVRITVENLERLLQWREVRDEVTRLEERGKKGEEWVEKARGEMDVLKEKQERQRKALDELGQLMPDMKMLSDIREWYGQQRHLVTAEKEVREELRLWEKDGITEEQLKKAVVEVEKLKVREEEIKEKLGKAREELIVLNTRKQLADFAHDLREGEKCPLCGALSHPHPLHGEEVTEELVRKLESITALETEEKAVRDNISTRVLVVERGRMEQERGKGLREKLERRRMDVQFHREKFVWKDYSPEDEDKLNKELERAAQLEKEKRRLEEERRLIEVALEKQRVNVEKYTTALEQIRWDIAQQKARKQLLEEQLTEFEVEKYDAMQTEEVRGKVGELRSYLKQVEANYQQGSERMKLLEAEFQKWHGSVEEKVKEVESVRKDMENVERELEELLKQSDYTSLSPVREVLVKDLDVPVCREQIERYSQQLHAVQKRKEELQGQVVGVTYRPDEHSALLKQLEEAGERERELLATQGALTNLLRDMEQRQAERLRIERELTGLEVRLQNLRVLKLLFRGNDFVKFVSSIYLQNLCNAANERFYRMTRQRLKLELNEENDFVVRDFMNEGRVRSARTLSGGQVFQASLSLALALTDNIRHLMGCDQNFFFLDEGFGSLDKESLAIVFDTLKSLREENRIVGLISHVEEMKQELPVYLFVENTAEHGSRIEFRM